MTSLWIDSHVGLGDQIYMRPFVRKIAQERDVWITTPWPDLWDSSERIHLLRYEGALRTQAKNTRVQTDRFEPRPKDGKRSCPTYSQDLLAKRRSVIQALEVQMGVFDPALFIWDPPQSSKDRASEVVDGRPVCLYRLPTLRSEWLARSRNPDRGVMKWLFEKAKETHHVIAIADLKDGQEWLDVDEEEWPESYLHGELSYSEIGALMQQAEIVLTPIGFPLPMGLSVGANMLIAAGGFSPTVMFIDDRLDLSRLSALEPDNFCHCLQMDHNCTKAVSLDRMEAAWQTALSATRPSEDLEPTTSDCF